MFWPVLGSVNAKCGVHAMITHRRAGADVSQEGDAVDRSREEAYGGIIETHLPYRQTRLHL